ncbi:hypothetical protein [Mesorhizobium sp. M2A.F.Ca.ET.043.02.1.1]|uniref:hypothetical protein n=1 Tax=Mesorhizobium sp. M2A.F.Ca.ET.043.02.1.1 TaxID=2493670 RepID=UPI000F76292E|nr:hypothetical protein [Mesorhizobium sp. M2A.F.Ca.ET.043.02.1.1]AZO05601.1 hypothetical protein EJ068_22910 [Mesorhizobium sp. M2A.F.Ca.ET.043.02.1.1]
MMDGEPDRVSEREMADMSFKVRKEWHREFKLRALIDGISMTDLLKRSYAEYKENHPLVS